MSSDSGFQPRLDKLPHGATDSCTRAETAKPVVSTFHRPFGEVSWTHKQTRGLNRSPGTPHGSVTFRETKALPNTSGVNSCVTLIFVYILKCLGENPFADLAHKKF